MKSNFTYFLLLPFQVYAFAIYSGVDVSLWWGGGGKEIYQLIDKGVGAGAPLHHTLKGGRSALSMFYQRLKCFVLFNSLWGI